MLETDLVHAPLDEGALADAERVFSQRSIRLVTSRVWKINGPSTAISITEVARMDSDMHPQAKPRQTLKTELDFGRGDGGQVSVEAWGPIGWMPVHSVILDAAPFATALVEAARESTDTLEGLPEDLVAFLSAEMARATREAIGFFI